MRRAACVCLGVIFLGFCLCTSVAAQTPASVSNGAKWLQSQVQTDGSLSAEAQSIALPLQSREETYVTLQSLGLGSGALSTGVTTLDPQGNTEFLARQVIVASQSGESATGPLAALLANQNSDGGFGGDSGDSSDALDTAWALLALRATSYSSSAVLGNALQYLVGVEDTDGGYGFPASGSGSQVYVTAYVLFALQGYASSYSLSTQIASITKWLISEQVSGIYSDTLTNAVAALALESTTTDTSTFQGAVGVLQADQSADGSWADDPYLTALAVRALNGAANQPTTPTTGTINGSVLDGATHLSIVGAQIVVTSSGTSASGSSRSDGGFSLANLVPGSYTVSVSANGYGAATFQGVQVTAGAVTNLGIVQLSTSASTASLSGHIASGTTGGALVGATITLSGADAVSTASAADGSYSFSNLTPGGITITVSDTGYDTVTANATATLGVALNFSPSLYTAGTAPVSATLVGLVEDAGTNTPISGATLSVGANSVQTDGNGKFNLDGLAAGSFSASVSAAGYTGATLNGTLVNGVNDAGTIRLTAIAPANNLSFASGVVTDAATQQPISGATVQVQGTSLTVVTAADGSYTISNIQGSQFALLISASGYISTLAHASLKTPGPVTVNAALVRNVASGLVVKSVTLSQASYNPYAEAEIDAEIDNTTGQVQSVLLDAQVVDALGNVVANIPAIGLVLGQNASDALKTIPAGGSLDQDFTFYVRNSAAGTYHVVVQVTNLSGTVLAQGGAALAVNQLAQVGGGISLSPPISQVGSTQPIQLSASVENLGNLPLAASQLQLQITLDDLANVPPSQLQVSNVLSGTPLSDPQGAAIDTAGNTYVVNYSNREVIKVAPDGTSTIVTTLPATAQVGSSCCSVSPVDVALDSSGNVWVLAAYSFVFRVAPGNPAVVTTFATGMSSQKHFDIDKSGNLYITGTLNSEHVLEEMTPAGQLTTLVGDGLSSPLGLVVDGAGDFLVANHGDGTISKVNSSGQITPFATGLDQPWGMASDTSGNLYVANSGANNVVKVTPAGVTSVFASGLSDPFGITVDGQGNVFVTSLGNNSVSKITSDGQVTTFAASAANGPEGLAYDSAGNLYISNNGNSTITKVDPSGTVSTVASISSPRALAADSVGSLYVASEYSGAVYKVAGGHTSTYASGLNDPYGVATDGAGNLYVTENGANRITEITSGGTHQLVAQSLVLNPGQVRVGNDGVLLVANSGYISHLPLGGGGSVFAGSLGTVNGFIQAPDGDIYYRDHYSLYKLDPATGARVTIGGFNYDSDGGLVEDASGNLYLTDEYNNRILKVDASGTVSTFATLRSYVRSLAMDANGNLYTIVDSASNAVFKIAPDGTATLLATLSNGLTNLAVDGNGNILVTNSSLGTVTAITPGGVASTILSGLPQPNGIAVLQDGSIAVGEDTGADAVQVFSPTGTLTKTIYGFSGPKAVAVSGNAVVFSDQYNRVYSITAGNYPTVLANVAADYLDVTSAGIYVTNGNGVKLISGGTVSSYFTYQGSPISGIASGPGGTLSLGVRNNSQIVTLDASKNIVASFVGLNQPRGIAVDSAGNVYVGNYAQNDIIKLNAAGKFASVYTTAVNQPRQLSFDSTGTTLYASNYNGIFSINAAQNQATQIVSGGNTNAFVLSGGKWYATQYGLQMLAVSSSEKFVPFAIGLANPQGVRVAADGSVYIADYSDNAILRYAGGGLSVFATGVNYAQVLNFDASGNLYVAGNSALEKISPTGQIQALNALEPYLGSAQISGLAVDAGGDLLVAESNNNSVQEIQFPKPQTLPTPGSVVYTTAIAAPALPLGSSPAAVNFGNWSPSYGGDYTVTVTEPGVAGALVNTIHVGPHAQGELVAKQTTVPPGDQSVDLSLNVQGADFASIAKVNGSNLQVSVKTGAYPSAMGADANGDIYFLNGSTLERESPTGTISSVATGLRFMRGQVPVDSHQNIYAVKYGSSGYELIQITPAGQTNVIAALPGSVTSLAITQDDVLYAAIGSTLYRVSSSGSLQIVYGGLRNPYSITTDGQGNIYVEEEVSVTNADGTAGNPVLKISPSGTATVMTSAPQFEFEGVNMAGDCANDLFLTSIYWPAIGQQHAEEHVLGEIVGSTGQVASVLDGLSISPLLGDMDFLIYDHFHSNLLIWTDDSGGQIYTLPVSCGAIDTEAHIITPSGQALTGFSVAPTATIAHSDGSIEYVWDMQAVNASGQNLQFETTLDGLTLGESQPVASSAFLVFKNTFVPGELTLPIPVPSVQVGPLVNLTATTDAASYPPDANVAISTALVNPSSTDVSGTLDVQIQDASNTKVADVFDQSVTVNGNGTLSEPTSWNSGITLAGAYHVHATLTAADGTLLAQADSNFAITTGTATGTGLVTVGVTTDKATYSPLDTVQITDRLTNVTANALAGNLTVVTTVTNPDGSIRWTNTATVAQIVPGALANLPYSLPLSDAPPGSYGVTLAVSEAGTPVGNAQASFTVQSSAATGIGLNGTLVAAPTEVPLGTGLVLTGSVSNHGNATANNLTATLAVLDPVANKLVFQSPVTIASLAQGDSTQLVANWTAAGTVNQTYVALLTATINGQTTTLAHTNFVVVPPPIKLNTVQTESVLNRVLVLMGCSGDHDDDWQRAQGRDRSDHDQDHDDGCNCDEGHGGDWHTSGAYGHGNHGEDDDCDCDPEHDDGVYQAQSRDHGGHDQDDDCTAKRVAAIDGLLTGLAVAHHISTSMHDFIRQLRSGEYNQFWILRGLGDWSPSSLSEELEETVFGGGTLLVDGEGSGWQNWELFAAAGTRVHGALPHSASLTVNLEAPLFTPGSLSVSGSGLWLDTSGGTVNAEFNYSRCQGDDDGDGDNDGDDHRHCQNAQAPAVVSAAYGEGRAVALGFDLSATLENTANTGWPAALDKVIQYLLPAPPAAVLPHAYLPVTTTIQNQGIAVTLDLTDALPAGATYVDALPTPTSVAQGQINWQAPLAENQSLSFTLGLSAPALPGDYALTGNISTITSGPALPYGTSSYPFSVSDPQALSQTVESEISALKVSWWEKRARDAALHELHDGERDEANHWYDGAIHQLLESAEYLEGIRSADTSRAREDLDSLIVAYELNWYWNGGDTSWKTTPPPGAASHSGHASSGGGKP